MFPKLADTVVVQFARELEALRGRHRVRTFEVVYAGQHRFCLLVRLSVAGYLRDKPSVLQLCVVAQCGRVTGRQHVRVQHLVDHEEYLLQVRVDDVECVVHAYREHFTVVS